MTHRDWHVRRAHLRTRRDPVIEAVVVDPGARIIEVDREVWTDPEADPHTIPEVVTILKHAEHCREERATHGRDHLSLHCHRLTRPVLRVIHGEGQRERRIDAG